MLIGIIGTICAGKTEATEYVENKGFSRLAIRDEVLIEAISRGHERDSIDRELMQEVGRELEDRYPGYWSRRIIERILPETDYIHRNPKNSKTNRNISNST